MKRIYFDYAAGTPVDPAVMAAMEPYFTDKFGNPGSLHSFGQEAIAAVDASRESIARTLGLSSVAGFRQIVFTGSATEANNLALRGAVAAYKEKNPGVRAKLVVSEIEHESVLETARDLGEHENVEVLFLPVDACGVIDLEKLKTFLDDRTVIVSVMYANNEVGTVQPIKKIAEMIGDVKNEKKSALPLFHTDAAQAFQFFDCSPESLGVDLMTISSHKIYGPKGIGALYVKNMKALRPVVTGGGQEFGLRSGTENVPAIVGFAKAVEQTAAVRAKESERLAELRARFWNGIKKIVLDAEINGVGENNKGETLPNILNIYFPGRAAQDVLTKLDLGGVAASSGSACRSRALEASYVLEAMGYSKERAKESIRFSLGRLTTREDIEAVVKLF